MSEITDLLLKVITKFNITNNKKFTLNEVTDISAEWANTCFGPDIVNNLEERNYRFLEEALELVQSLHCSKEDAHKLVDYVYNKPVGDPEQETGGVLVSLALLCYINNIDLNEAFHHALIDNYDRIEKIRLKQSQKPAIGPLP
jgi:NTP pyrophosphatase (non-canonical NTP hydrolase)